MKKVMSIALLLALLLAIMPTAAMAQDDGEEELVTTLAIVAEDVVAVRAEPNIRADVLGTLEFGTEVVVVEVDDLFTVILFEDVLGNPVEGYAFTADLFIFPAPQNIAAVTSTRSPLAVRAEPTISADVLFTLPNGSNVGILAINETGLWAEIYSSEGIGWTFLAELVQDPEANPATFLADTANVVSSGPLTVRETPAAIAETAGAFSSGDVVYILEEEGDFAFVFGAADSSLRGWVFSDRLVVTAPRAIGVGAVNVDRLNFRSTPDTSGTDNIIRQVTLGEEVLILGVSEDFAFFNVVIGEDTGWLSTAFVDTDAVDLTIAGIATASADFETLVTAVLAADPAVLEALSGEGPLTVFAPTNDAFAALGDEALNAVLADQELLTNVLLYHVIEGNVLAADVVALAGGDGALTVPSLLEGDSLNVTIDADGNVFVDGIQVVAFDIQASNGVIHVISGVLIPDGE